MSIKRGPQQKLVHLNYGRMDKLRWDLNRFRWSHGGKKVPFLEFTAG
jgi:hypothetical protein